jgi:hypothetical protein
VHFTIFLPDWTPSHSETLEDIARKRGVADLLGGHDVMPLTGGADNPANATEGTLIGWLSPENQLLEYRPARQLWLPSVARDDVAGQPLYFVGMWNEFVAPNGRPFGPPKERDLRRHYTQEGVLTQFGEEHWLLPTPDTVDARAVYADDGQSMRWEPLRQFAWMVDEAKQMQQRYLDNGLGEREMVFEFDPKEQCDWLLKLLRVNYRITPEVAVHLNLWTRKRHIIDTVLATLGLKRKE